MKKRNWLCVAMCLSQVILIDAAPRETNAAIIGSVATGEESASAPKKPRPVFDIKNTGHRVIKGRSMTIHEVSPPPVPVAKKKPSPAAQPPKYTEEESRKLVEEMIAMRVVILSATVYGEGRSQLTKIPINQAPYLV